MQVDPQAQPIVVTTPAGGLALDPGRQVVARVVEIDDSGNARISLAGQTITVAQSDVQLRHGDTLNLTVASTSGGQVTLRVDGTSSAAAADPPPLAVARQLSELAPNAIRELARAGVPVTPQLAQSVSKAVELLVGEPGSGGPSAETAARAVANLIARDAGVNGVTAGRVAAALDLAGRLGTSLADLAKLSPEVAAALPGATPGGAALRSLVGGSLAPAELALARIAQAITASQAAQAAAPGGPVTLPTPPSSSPSVIANYVASQVAVTGRLDALAAANNPLAVSTAQAAKVAAAPVAPGAGQGAVGNPAAAASTPAPIVANIPLTATLGATPPAVAAQQAANAARPQSTAAAATSSAAGSAPTPPAVAVAIANLSGDIARFAAALAPAVGGALGDATQAQARALSATQGQAPAGTFTPAAAGGGAGGAPAPLVAAMREALLASGDQQQQQATRTLLQTLAHYDPSQVRAAFQQLPESQSLQLAGRLLELVPHGMQGAMSPGEHAELRHSVHNALQELGKALLPGTHDDQAVLRAALQHVADNDPRPAVADQARQIMHASEGQQVLSQLRTGADPGYVYFQVPLPGERSAEVIVRREAGRRSVTFDSFDIAFLLSTEAMGTLMVHLDAHPGAVKARITTDVPSLEPFLAQQAEAMREPVEREARRPLIVTTGVFNDGAVPTSLLEPQLGMVPGENAYYA